MAKSKGRASKQRASGARKRNSQLAPDRGLQQGDLLNRISIDPNICHGKPCIRGHRIWVSLILDFLAGGMTPEEILDDYPGIEEADIRACIAYGSEMTAVAATEDQ